MHLCDEVHCVCMAVTVLRLIPSSDAPLSTHAWQHTCYLTLAAFLPCKAPITRLHTDTMATKVLVVIASYFSVLAIILQPEPTFVPGFLKNVYTLLSRWLHLELSATHASNKASVGVIQGKCVCHASQDVVEINVF